MWMQRAGQGSDGIGSLLGRGLITWLGVAAHTVWVCVFLRVVLGWELVQPQGLWVPDGLLAALVGASAFLQWALERTRGGRSLSLGLGVLALPLVLAVGLGLPRLPAAQWPAAAGQGFLGWEQGLPAGVPLVLVAALAWVLGATVGWCEHAVQAPGLALGVAGLGFALVVAGPAQLARLGVQVPLVLVTYVLCALGSLALLGIREAQVLGDVVVRRPGGSTLALGFSRPWLLTVALLLLLALVAGWAAAQVFSPDLARAAWGALLRYVGGPLMALWGFWTRLLARLAALLTFHVPDDQGFFQEEELLDLAEEPLPLPEGGAALATALVAGAALLLLLGLAALLIVRAPRRRQRPLGSLEADERESVWSGELVRVQVGALLERLRRAGARAYLSLAGEGARRREVRLLYRRLLGAMRRRHLGRRRGDTPRAYARRLRERAALDGEALQALTEAYITARYSPTGPTTEEVERARGAWRQLQALLRRVSPHIQGVGPRKEDR